MRATAIALITSLLLLSTNAFGQESTQWRTVAESISLGSKVKVHLADGKRINGTLMRVDDTSMMVKRNTRMPEPAVTIAFDRVANLERDHGGMNFAKALGIAAATGAGIMTTLFVIAMQID
jgi:small nuclear ribonucleoprotein (snRNP)-like protein